jgi:RecA/RadA recombinase
MMAAKKKATKRATKPATKKAGPKRAKTVAPKKRATQLQVMAQAQSYFQGHKKFGGQLQMMDALDNTVPGYVSSRSLALDWVVGNRGYPQSRVIAISGDEGTGKSTIGDQAMAEVQRQGGHAYLWDPENARDNRYQKKLGIARSSAGQILSHALEDGFEVMIEILNWHINNDPERPGIIVWDTPAGSPTRAELDPEKTDERFGPAKLIRSYLRKLNQSLLQTRWLLFVVNQTYRGQSPSGQTYKAVFGGGGIPFYSSCSLEIGWAKPGRVWRTSTDQARGLPPLGQVVYIKSTKNRCCPPYRNRTMFIEYGQGIDNYWTVYEMLKGSGAISCGQGGWNVFDSDFSAELAAAVPKKWQSGHHGLKQFVAEDPNVWPLLIEAYRSIEESWGG